jgi:predicted nucleic acid-binding protein
MAVLADSSAWISYFRTSSRNPAADKLEKLIQLESDVWLCGPVLSEVLRGVRDDAQHRKIAAILDSFDYAEADKGTYRYAAEIYRGCRAKGFTIRSTVDCIIAAIALQHDLEVLHDDRDFDAIARFLPLRIF